MKFQTKTEKFDETGRAIYNALQEKGISQYRLAKEIGISYPYLTDILQGNRPTSPAIKEIKKYLKDPDNYECSRPLTKRKNAVIIEQRATTQIAEEKYATNKNQNSIEELEKRVADIETILKKYKEIFSGLSKA
jgi:transcriptional regulator with XRE-family HTH domain